MRRYSKNLSTKLVFITKPNYFSSILDAHRDKHPLAKAQGYSFFALLIFIAHHSRLHLFHSDWRDFALLK